MKIEQATGPRNLQGVRYYDGVIENKKHCIEKVRFRYAPLRALHQCDRYRGHGPDGLYCKQHAKKFEAKK
jgi:hypothetical protein